MGSKILINPSRDSIPGPRLGKPGRFLFKLVYSASRCNAAETCDKRFALPDDANPGFSVPDFPRCLNLHYAEGLLGILFVNMLAISEKRVIQMIIAASAGGTAT